MEKFNSIDKIAKIATGVPGFDDLFFGGLRLPDYGKGIIEEGLCIIISGNRSVGKSCLAMQIMRGVDIYLKGNGLSPKYKSLNFLEEELRKRYVSLEVSKWIDNARLPIGSIEDECKFCQLFPGTKEKLGEFIYSDERKCSSAKQEKCNILKMIRHELINYNYNSQSIHWTIGPVNDSDNFIASLDSKLINTDGIFDKNKSLTSDYTSVTYKLFKEYQKEIYDSVNESHRTSNSDDKNTKFQYSCFVMDGFTAFNDDELFRLPLTDLVMKLKKIAAVSILVLDERAKNMHFYADVIIDMKNSYDKETQYTYSQLQVTKSDLQQHVHGWHKYRKLRDLSIKIFPSVHSLLLRRFTADSAVLRLSQNKLCYPQSLLERFKNERIVSNKDNKDFEIDFLRKLFQKDADKYEETVVYRKEDDNLKVSLVSTDQKYNDLLNGIATSNKDSTYAFLLLGVTELNLRKKISVLSLSKDILKKIYCWESGLGCIWADEFLSILKEYIQTWKKYSRQEHLHIIIDNIANIDFFPLMKREKSLIPAIVNVCRSESMYKGYEDTDRNVDNNNRRIDINLTFICTDTETIEYRQINKLITN